MMAEIIPVNATLKLRAADESHVPALHQLVLKNKAWLQQSLDWPQYVTSQDETCKYVHVAPAWLRQNVSDFLPG